MEKFKVCPNCGTKNPPMSMDCTECFTDLTSVRITDELTLDKPDVHSSQKLLVRICDCGSQNPSNARKCVSCGEDISDIIPIEIVEGQNSFIISSLDGEFAYQINEQEVIIGREGPLQHYLSSKKYVSRVQCKLYYENNDLFIENLSQTNPTFINNEIVTSKVKLNDGDEIGLGGNEKDGKRQDNAAYFLVRIGSCI